MQETHTWNFGTARYSMIVLAQADGLPVQRRASALAIVNDRLIIIVWLCTTDTNKAILLYNRTRRRQ